MTATARRQDMAPKPHCSTGQLAICETCQARSRSICSGAPDEDMAVVAALTRTQSFLPHTALVREGQSADAVFNIVSGCAKVSKMLPDGRQQIVGFLLSGDFVGLAIDDTYSYTVEAVTEVTACRVARGGMRDLLQAYPAMERKLRQVASNELAIAQEQMLALGRKTALERVATFLLQMATRTGSIDRLRLPMTRTEIADYLGLTIETVSRTFTRLRRDEVIALEGAHIVHLRDVVALREVAEGYRAD